MNVSLEASLESSAVGIEPGIADFTQNDGLGTTNRALLVQLLAKPPQSCDRSRVRVILLYSRLYREQFDGLTVGNKNRATHSDCATY
jgi:hypothetical protein